MIYYALARGRKTGVFTDASVVNDSIYQYPGFRVRKFDDRYLAEAYVELYNNVKITDVPDDMDKITALADKKRLVIGSSSGSVNDEDFTIGPLDWEIFTDGSYFHDGHRGGYAAVLVLGRHTDVPITVSGGKKFPKGCNIGMELVAAVKGLKRLKRIRPKGRVFLYTDCLSLAKYGNGEESEVPDTSHCKKLWKKVQKLSKLYSVRYIWVKGHSGVPLNEYCDRLARLEAGFVD